MENKLFKYLYKLKNRPDYNYMVKIAYYLSKNVFPDKENSFTNQYGGENIKLGDIDSLLNYLKTAYNQELPYIMENKYGIKFYHDFNENYNILEIINKYQRRIKRFFDLIKTGQNIIFIRDEIKMNNITIDQVENFISIIKNLNNK